MMLLELNIFEKYSKEQNIKHLIDPINAEFFGTLLESVLGDGD